MKFLIVDDDSRVRRLIGSVVAEPSDTVYECSDGAQAHACYREHQPDWVLMDLMMPEVDGLAATREIKASHPAARIIIVTNHDSQGLREEAAGAGAMAYVAKENLLALRDIMSNAEFCPSASA